MARLRMWQSGCARIVRELAHSSERASQKSLTRVRLIAEDFTRPHGYDVRTVLLQHKDKSKIFRHEIYPANACSASDPILKILEKRSSNAEELVFYRRLAEAGEGARPEVAPRVYHIDESSLLELPEFRNHMFLEHLPDTGLRDLTDEVAAKLARSMIKVADLPCDEASGLRRTITRLDSRLLEQFIAVLKDHGHVEQTVAETKLKEMRADWARLLDRDPDLSPMVPCHNDLHDMNVGSRSSAPDANYVFFDWEQCALNHLGSDLHHFLASGLMRSKWSAFSNALQKEYGRLAQEIHGVRQRDVDFAASSYALYKCMVRSIARKKDALQIRAAVMLFDRLKGIAGLIATVILGEPTYAFLA